MAWLGLLLGILAAGLLVPRLLATLDRAGARRPNHRGVELPTPAGIAVLVPGLVVLGMLTVLTPLLAWAWLSATGAQMPIGLPGVPGALADVPDEIPSTALFASAWAAFLTPVFPILLFPLACAAAGLVDDLVGGEERGLRGHGGAARRGRTSTGAVKVLIIGTAALAVASTFTAGLVRAPIETLLFAGLLALSANLLNLLDLRPGRAAKGLVVLLVAAVVIAFASAGTLGDVLPGLAGQGLAATAAQPTDAPGRLGAALNVLAALGPWLAPIALVAVHDLRERAMLGDTGANLLGGVGGLALALALLQADSLVLTGTVVAALLAVTILGELTSLTSLIERTPGLRHLDALGRKSTHG